MKIYPIKRNLVGNPISYTGPMIILKKVQMGDGRSIHHIKLPKMVAHISPGSHRKTFTNLAHMIV